jgi:hypothetical protein
MEMEHSSSSAMSSFRVDHGSLEEDDVVAPLVSGLMRLTRCSLSPYTRG